MSIIKTPWYILHAPEIGMKFDEFYKICNKEGVLDKKTKELLMLAVASVCRCSECVEEHMNGALGAGATKGDITETLLVAAAETTKAQLVWTKQICGRYMGDNSHK